MGVIMFGNLTPNSVFWLVIGIALIIGGAYVGISWRTYPLAAGLAFMGLGSSFCGITNGFTDYSPAGRMMWKFGIPALLIGLLLTGYSLYRFV